MTIHQVLVIGVGSIGERHLRCFQSTGRAKLIICDVNADFRTSVAERYGVEAFADLGEALQRRPNIVLIATPAHLHVPMALAAVQSGASVLIEKPLSTKCEGLSELEEAASSVTAGVAYVYRCHPALKAMREAVRSERFGSPVQIVATSGQHFPTYRPAYQTIYYRDRATGGGAVQDALTHVINAAEWVVGPVDRVAADVGHQVLAGVEVEDTAHVLTRHGRVMGAFSLNQYQAPNEMTITVVCERGTVRFESHAHRWQWMTEPGGKWINEVVPELERDTLFIRQADTFLNAVERRESPPCSLSEARQTLAVNLAILRAAERRTWERVG